MRRLIIALFLGVALWCHSGCAIEDFFGGKNSDESYLNNVNTSNRNSFPPA